MHNQQRLASRILGLATIFVALLIIFSSSVVNVFSVDQFTPTPEPVVPQTIESNDSKVRQEGTWPSVTTANASSGSYIHNSGSASDTLAVDFTGTTLQVVYVEDPSFGSFTVEIDNTAVRTVTATGTSAVFGVTADFAGLSEGTHTLRIIGIQGTVAIDAFVANDFSRPWQTYNDDHVDLMYRANSWTHQSLTGASGGTVATTSDRGSMLTFYFEGTGVELVYATDENGGVFAVHVDFESRHAGNSVAATSETGHTLTVTDLEDGNHRVDVLKGEDSLRLEAIRVQGQLLPPPYTLPASTGTTGFQTESVQPPTGSCDYSASSMADLISDINDANANSGHDTICLTTGYTYIVDQTYTDDWSGKNAFPVITSSITIDGNGATIRRDVFTPGANSDFRYFYIDLGAEVTIDGLTLQYGDPESQIAENSGGAIYNVGELHLINVTLENNVSEGNGGAISNGGDLTITGSDIRYNDADGYGGAISNLGGNTIQITASTIDHNQAATGGAIYADFGGTTTIQNTTIVNNWSNSTVNGFGGAFRVYDTPFTITNTSIGNNDAYNGGALYAELHSGYFTITNSCLYGNANTAFANDVESLANINAPNNWWGTHDGPSNIGPGTGDSITFDVTYTGFLSSPPVACPVTPPVCTGQSSGFQPESASVPGGGLTYCIPQITPTPSLTASQTLTFTPSPTTTIVFPQSLTPDANPTSMPPGETRCNLEVLANSTMYFFANPYEASEHGYPNLPTPAENYHQAQAGERVLPMLFWEGDEEVMLVRYWDNGVRQWGWINTQNIAKWVYEPSPHADAPPEVCNGQFPTATSGNFPPTPTFTPSPTVTGTPPTATPTPTITPTPNAAQISQLLLSYGVYVIDETNTYSQSDMQAVYDGVVEIGAAYSKFSSVYTNNPEQAFRAIMLEDPTPSTIDVTDRLIVVLLENRSAVNCQTYPIRGYPADYKSNLAQVTPSSGNLSETAIDLVINGNYGSQEHRAYISCHPNTILSEYTVVHEMGHVFDNSSDLGSGSSNLEIFSLTDHIQATDLVSADDTGAVTFPIKNDDDIVVMGRVLNKDDDQIYWTQGDDGWGSGPSSQLTNFRQHPLGRFIDDKGETAADMFLNWVYRTVTDTPNVDLPTTGFRNYTWNESSCSGGCPDPYNSGNARFSWMNTSTNAKGFGAMQQIFTRHGW